MDNLVSLRVFVTVAELKSFTAAAERLDLSPAMASKHIQNLEQRVGARLLNRTSRSVSTTEDGALYLNRVRSLLDGLDEAEAQIGETRSMPRGSLRVSLPEWMATAKFAKLISDYQERYPGVKLDLDLQGRMVNLVSEGYDLALRSTFTLDEGLIARRVAWVPFYLVASPALLDRVGRPEAMSDLNGKPYLAYSRYGTDGHIKTSKEEGDIDIRFKPILSSNSDALLLHAAVQAMGFTFQTGLAIEEALAAGKLEIVLPERLMVRSPLYAVYPSGSYLPAKVRTFLDFLVERNKIGWVTTIADVQETDP